MTFRLQNDGLEYEPMPPADLQSLRKVWDMSRVQFGEYLGYTGERRNIFMTVKRLETGNREIPPMVERLAMLLEWYRADHGYLPDLDNGERKPRSIVAEPVDESVRSD